MPTHSFRQLLIVAFAAAVAACSSIPENPAPMMSDAVLLGRLFDAEKGRVIDQGVVVIDDGKVRCAGTIDACEWGPGSPIHDYGKALILPGLIDLHVHARPHYVGAFLPSGVTTVRDAGNSIDTVGRLRVVEGAPRVLASGPMLDGATTAIPETAGRLGGARPLSGLMPIVVGDAEGAAAAVTALVEAGVDWIKLYEQLSPDAFTAAVGAAHAARMPVMVDLGMALTRGLSGSQVDIVDAAHARVETNEHLSGLALAYRKRGGLPFSSTVDEAVLDGIVAEIAESGMAVVPTLASALQFESPGSLSIESLPGAGLMSPYFTPYWTQIKAVLVSRVSSAGADRRLMMAALPKLKAKGVLIGAGSDLPAAPYMLPGSALHEELAALVQAGLTPTEALQAATWNAAKILRRDDIGRLSAGAQADVLVVDGDASRNILDTRRIVAVWYGGRPIGLNAAWQKLSRSLADALRSMP